jgi:tRNA pseudouridine32 synthase/23S rRNA pseudouridine746 synthase
MYPELLPADTDDLDRPLQLLARSLAFTDPISAQPRRFESRRQLAALTDTDKLKPSEVAAAARR